MLPVFENDQKRKSVVVICEEVVKLYNRLKLYVPGNQNADSGKTLQFTKIISLDDDEEVDDEHTNNEQVAKNTSQKNAGNVKNQHSRENQVEDQDEDDFSQNSNSEQERIGSEVEAIFSSIDNDVSKSDILAEDFFGDSGKGFSIGKNTTHIIIAFHEKTVKTGYMEGIKKRFSNVTVVAKNSIFQIKGNDRRLIYLFGTKETRDSWSDMNEGLLKAGKKTAISKAILASVKLFSLEELKSFFFGNTSKQKRNEDESEIEENDSKRRKIDSVDSQNSDDSQS